MQEVTLKIHNIQEGEEPPKDGYYLVVVTPNNEVGMLQYYWNTKKHAWTVDEDSDTMLTPYRHIHSLWCDINGLRGLVL